MSPDQAREEALHIQATLGTPGYRLIEAMLDEQANEMEGRAIALVRRNPELLTGRIAIKAFCGSGALFDFKESVHGRLAILNPTPKRGGS